MKNNLIFSLIFISLFNWINGKCHDGKINPNFVKTNGLTNYWPFSFNAYDLIEGADLLNGVNFDFTFDRFNKSRSALNLTNGFMKFPSRVYFSSSFTIMVWVKVKLFNAYSRIIDIGNGAADDNVILMITFGSNGPIQVSIFDKSVATLYYVSNVKLTINKWQHVAFVLDFPIFYLYLDGNRVAIGNTTKTPNNVVRSSGYLGRSNWVDPYSNADFDELKFFNRALSLNEVLFEMNNEIII